MKWKRTLAFALALCLVLALSPGALAVELTDAGTAAGELHEMGLFEGTSENADGTPKASYQEGDLVATMVLSDAYAWYQEFEVAIGDLDADDFYIEEVGMTSSDEHVDDDPVYAGGGIGYESLIEFPAYTMQEAIDAAVEEGG